MAAPWGHVRIQRTCWSTHRISLKTEKKVFFPVNSHLWKRPVLYIPQIRRSRAFIQHQEFSKHTPLLTPSHRAFHTSQLLSEVSPDEGKSQARRRANLFISKRCHIPAATCMLAGWAHCKSQLGGRPAGRGWSLEMGYF